MKKLIFIPLLIFSVLCNAQFTKGGGTFLKTGNYFMTTTPAPPGPVEPPSFLTSDGDTYSWLEASASNITTYLGHIKTWADIGPNDHDFVTGVNGVQTFDDVNQEVDLTNDQVEDRLENTVSGDPLTVATIYIVVRINDYTNASVFLGLSHTNGSSIIQLGSISGIGLYLGEWNVSISNVGSGYGLITAVANTTASSLRWNDETAATGNAGSGTFERFFIGQYTGNAASSIKEIIIRSTVDSAQEIIDVTSYLNNKYSLF